MNIKTLFGTVATAALVAAAPAGALTIQLNNLNNVTAGTDALRGFTAAAHFWESVISNNVTVKLNVGFSQLAPNVLGSTSSTTNVAYVGNVLPAIRASGASRLDAIAVLPTTRASSFVGGAAFDALISGPKANGSGVLQPPVRVLDNNASANNSAFSANTSLMKALGLTPAYTGANAAIQADGTVQFSNQFNFDFNPENGISSNAIDFIGVAIHEIGHALGFRSGVDTYNGNLNFSGNLGDFALFSIWDIFRYSAASTAMGVNDLAIGGTVAQNTAPYFSLDGGATIFTSPEGRAYFSTGTGIYGDGRQASHWKDNVPGSPQLGLLDPTVAFGQQSEISSLDLAAYDAMGWSLTLDALRGIANDKKFSTRILNTTAAIAVPEPATWALMIGGFGMVGGAVRRQRRSGFATA